MSNQESKKWEGETTVEIKSYSPEQIWPLISDFTSLTKWFPHVATCDWVGGPLGQPGMIRYCASPQLPGGAAKWVKERLVMIDNINKCFSYDIVDNNAGFKTYVSTVRLESMDGCDGCRIVWSFVADPVHGFTRQSLVGFVESVARVMARKLEEALCNK